MLKFSAEVSEPKNAKLITYNDQQQDLFLKSLDFSNITTSSIAQLLDETTKTIKATFDEIAQLQSVSFANVIQPLINLDIAKQATECIIELPMHMHCEEAVRTASAEAKKNLDKFKIEQDLREDVYLVFKQYTDTVYHTEAANLTHEERLYISDLKTDYRRNGLELKSVEDRSEIETLQKRLAELDTEFSNNLNEEKTEFEFTKSELTGLPESWFAAREPQGDKYKVTLKYPDFIPVMDYVHDRAVRKTMYMAFNSRCKDENLPLILETLKLRNRLATLLGYDSYVDYATENKMTTNAKNVAKFLEEMNQRFVPLLKNNLNAMRQFARVELKCGVNFEPEIYDMRYIIKAREKALCDIDHQEIQKYFPREKVVTETLQIYQEILGLTFVAKDTTNKWHADVNYFEVFDSASMDLLGTFYLDLAPREGKYGHAAVFSMINGADISKFTLQKDSRQPNTVAMLCNFPEKENLTFDDVITFFHEFGHVMHVVCSKTQLASNNGFNVELDFVEAPSQMLENWCYDQRILERLSAHSETGKPIPVAIVSRILESERLHAGYSQKRQLGFSTFDYKLHMLNAKQLENLDLYKFSRDMQHEILLLPRFEDAHPASFTHLFGYGAGYYGYMYSDVVAKCMFEEKFIANPLDKRAGAEYRKFILEPGRTKPAAVLVQDFLGHEPTIDAFLTFCGLEANLEKPILIRQERYMPS